MTVSQKHIQPGRLQSPLNSKNSCPRIQRNAFLRQQHTRCVPSLIRMVSTRSKEDEFHVAGQEGRRVSTVSQPSSDVHASVRPNTFATKAVLDNRPVMTEQSFHRSLCLLAGIRRTASLHLGQRTRASWVTALRLELHINSATNIETAQVVPNRFAL